MDVELIEESQFVEVQRFLEQVFGPVEPRKLDAAFWRWKCTDPHPFWPGSRGYVIRRGGEIVAYGCLIPVRFYAGGEEVRGGHVIDWSAAGSVPGVGAVLYRHIQTQAGPIIAIGGSQDARRLLAVLGREAPDTVRSFQRPARPWAANMRRRWDWKTPARLVRDIALTLRPLADASDLQCVRVERFGDEVEPALPAASDGVITPVRTVELLNYWLACPAAQMYGYVVKRREEIVGYFLISVVAHAARIVDVAVGAAHGDLWSSVYSAAFRQASKLPRVWTMQAVSGHPVVCAALEVLRIKSASNQLLIVDPAGRLPAALPYAVSFGDGDGFYL